MKKIMITEKQLPTRVALVVSLQSMAFALELAGLAILLWLSLIAGIIMIAIPVAFEIAWGTYLMVRSAWADSNGGYMTTAGWMYICPLAQPVGAYFEIRYYTDQIHNRRVMARRKKAIDNKEKGE